MDLILWLIEQYKTRKRKKKIKILLEFLYWREKNIHPSDATNLIYKYLYSK